MAPDDESPTRPVRPADGELAAVSGTIESEDPTKLFATYAVGSVIGRGGGGEVVLALDRRIGREVAIKRMLGTQRDEPAMVRFEREARIQGRLDHPSVPPVYEIARDTSGAPFFAMKRLPGTTLAMVLAQPGKQQRALRAFAGVCHAIEFAHSRGIVHADLKPANIMLGDFDEVYVIDWGVALVVDPLLADELGREASPDQPMGTPGYTAPEQLRAHDVVGKPTDVYALGSILFEIVAGVPLHPRGKDAFASTLRTDVVTSPARRATDRLVPPELDALCVAMLAMNPGVRPSAAQVAARIQTVLDGDRDLAQRSVLAAAELEHARVAFARHDRVHAIRSAGRALALDPRMTPAADLIGRLLLEPPAESPPELRALIDSAEAEQVRSHARVVTGANLSMLLLLPLVIWNGVEDWPLVGALFAGASVVAMMSWQIVRRPLRSVAAMTCYALFCCGLIAVLTRISGPFLLVPTLFCALTMSMASFPVFMRYPALLIALMVGSFLLPIAIEQAGWADPTWSIAGGDITTHVAALAPNNLATSVILIAGLAMILVVSALDAGQLARSNRDARRQLVTYAWHLRQLLPRTAA